MVLEGKTVVVTGVGPGLGGEVAKLVLRDGGNAVLAARSADKLEAIAAEVDPSGARVAQLPTDIGDVDQCHALAQLAVDRFGAVDGVVQVAAYDGRLAGLDGTSDDEWHAVLGTNVVGSMHVITAMTEAMGDGGGSIVLIGSQSSVLPPTISTASVRPGISAATTFASRAAGSARSSTKQRTFPPASIAQAERPPKPIVRAPFTSGISCAGPGFGPSFLPR